MWLRLILLCGLSLSLPFEAMAIDACGSKDEEKQSTRFQIIESALADALALFNNIGSNIPADSIPEKINQTHKNHQGQWIYFDTPDLELLHTGKALKLNKKIRYNAQTPVNITLQSSEDTETKFSAKSYKRKITALDKHPLLGHVKRSEREHFLATLAEHQINAPFSLKPVLSLDFSRKSFVIRKHTTPVLTISFDAIESSPFGIGLYLYEFEITKASCLQNQPINTNEQEFINNLASSFEQQLLTQQIGTVATSNPYQRYWQAAEELFPLLPLTTHYPLLTALLQAIILVLIGGLVLWLILSRQAQKGLQ